ncbi:MAG: phytoene desaturase family protein [Candidatus Saccharibacteria bacterium]
MATSGTIIIIGAGIAGLSAGIYARKNGYDTTIYEMHDKPGGMCTSWKRGGYVFDYSIHNLAGTGKDAGLRKIWDELGALDGLEVLDYEEFVRVEDQEGHHFTMYSDIDRTVAELRRVSSQDETLIQKHEKMARKFGRMDMFAALLGGTGMLKMLPNLRTVSRLTKETLGDRALQFSDPFLRRAFPTLQYGFSNIPMAIHYVFQGGLDRGDLGSIKGGSLRFSSNLESRFLALGGKMHCRKKVAKILVQNDAAIGVELTDGTKHYADAVISAADGKETIFGMLDGRYANDLIKEYYTAWWPQDQEMGSCVYLGVRMDLTSEPHALTILFKEPFELDGRKVDQLDLDIYSSKTGMAPEGSGVIKVNLTCNYERWKKLRESRDAYATAKDQVIDTVIKALEPRFPGLGSKVEQRDMATLITSERFVGTFHGFQAWGPKREQTTIMRNGLSRTLPGLANFYMAGQWAEGSIGLPTAAVSGRRVIKAVCKKDGRKFTP